MAFEAGAVVARLRLVTEDFARGVRKAEKSTEDLRGALDRVSGTFGRIAAVSGAAFAAITGGLALASRTGARFEEAMVNVGAVTGAAGKSLEELSGIAVEMGETTIFSASQVADAMFNIGSQGVKAADDFRNVLKPALDLAAASQTDVNFASKALLSSIRAFGAPLSDATKFANIFSAANENSALTAEILSRALVPVGATASALGASFEDTTAILGGLVNAGFTAERAGTGLKTALALLQKATGPAAKELKKLGITEKDIARLSKDPIKLFGLLAERGITAAQAFKIFGTEGGPAVLAITKQIPSIRDLADAITGTDSAARIAEKQLAATSAKFKLMGSAVESSAIALFTALQPAITAIIERATEAAKGFAEWIRENQDLARNLAIAAVAVTGIVALVSSLIAVAAAAGAAIIGLKISFAGLGGILPGVAGKLTLVNAKMAAGKAGAVGFALGTGVLIGKWINSLPVMDRFFDRLGDMISKLREGNAVTGTAAQVNQKMADRMEALAGKVRKFSSDQKGASKAVAEFGDRSLGTLKTTEDATRIIEKLTNRIRVLRQEIQAVPSPEAEPAAVAGEMPPAEEEAPVLTPEEKATAFEAELEGVQLIGTELTDQDITRAQALEKQKAFLENLGRAINLEGKVGTAIDGILAGTRGVGESMQEVVKGLAQAVAKALALQLILAGIKALVGGGPLGKILGFREGGVVPGAQAGLLPPGEDMLVGVQAGEAILSRDAVRAVGGAPGVAAMEGGGGTVVNNFNFEGIMTPTQDQIEQFTELSGQARLGFAGGA